jgi:arylsulfatase A-like enzyme
VTGKRALPFVAVISVAAALYGCGSDGSQANHHQALWRALQDPQLVSFGFDAPDYRFDGRGGGLMLTEGWTPASRGKNPQSWVNGTHAALLFSNRGSGRAVFRARARALWWEGAPEQRMTVTLNGHPAGEVVTERQWRNLEVELPVAQLVPGMNRIDLHLSYSRKPKNLGLNADKRDLSVAFDWLAVDRHPEHPRNLGRRRTWIRSEDEVLVLKSGAVVGLPIAPGMSVQWQGLRAGVSVEMERPDSSWESLWSGDEIPPAGASVTAANTSNRVLFVRISHRGSPGTRPVRLDWSESSLRMEKIASAPPHQPNVFLYVVDTLRKDALDIYGGSRPTSPRLRQLAADGVVFEHTTVASTWTLPSVVSMITGVYPFEHGVMQGNIKLTADGGYPLLPQLLGDQGYDTVGISQSFVAGPQFGIDNGFQSFFLSNQLNSRTLRTGEMRRTLSEWLSNRPDWSRPAFVYLHTVGPHAPYLPPPEQMGFAEANPGSLQLREYRPARFVEMGHGKDPAEVDHLRALYDGEVAYADAELGRFLDLLIYFGLYDDSLVIFTSDHGEEFNDHGSFDHGRTMYEEVAEVPLIVKLPAGVDVPRGLRVQTRVSSLDLFPTILETAGIPSPSRWGRSLLQVIAEDGTESDPRPVFSEVNPVGSEIFESVDYLAAWLGETKCIYSRTQTDLLGQPIPPWQCFDLSSDPDELHALADDDPQAVACRQVLESWMRITEGSEDEVGPEVDDETTEMLRAVGYIE